MDAVVLLSILNEETKEWIFFMLTAFLFHSDNCPSFLFFFFSLAKGSRWMSETDIEKTVM